MAVLRISELPIETFISSSSVIVEPRVEKRVHDWSYLPPGEVEVKDASTATMLFDSSESIIDAICSHTRGSFSISWCGLFRWRAIHG